MPDIQHSAHVRELLAHNRAFTVWVSLLLCMDFLDGNVRH